MAISNSEGEIAVKEGERKRKRKGEARPSPSKWRSESEQKTYSSKLLEALRRVRGAAPAEPPRTHVVREAADRALAIAARGRTRWSRAILSSRTLKLTAARRRRAAASRLKRSGGSSSEKRRSPTIQRKARVLGRLVPGCRQLSFPKLLEETSDYIAALEMQVRAMSTLSEILSSIGSGSGAPPA